MLHSVSQEAFFPAFCAAACFLALCRATATICHQSAKQPAQCASHMRTFLNQTSETSRMPAPPALTTSGVVGERSVAVTTSGPTHRRQTKKRSAKSSCSV